MTYEIDNNIPMPKLSEKGIRKYPFAEMNVGDSFLIPYNISDKKEASKIRNSVRVAGIHFGTRNERDYKYNTAIVNEGIRVWRVS